MNNKVRILIIESDSDVSQNITEYLNNHGYTPDVVNDKDLIAGFLLKERYELIVMDQRFLDDKQYSAIRTIRRYDNGVDIVIMMYDPNIDMVLQLCNQGISKFIVKPFTHQEIDDVVRESLKCTVKNREYSVFSDNRKSILSVLEKIILTILT